MSLFQLKRCIFHTQMRKLVTLNMWNKYYTKMKGSLYWIELKYNNLNKSIFNTFKLKIDSEKNRKDIHLPPLMWYSGIVLPDPILNWIYSIYIVLTIDRDFSLEEFWLGAAKAISIISNALATQNYEALNEVIDKRALKVLKHRVDRLTPEQREVIAIKFPRIHISKIKIIKTKDENEVILQITTICRYSMEHDAESIIEMLQCCYICIYVFQRRYRSGVGGSWIVKLVNHESV